MPFPLTILAVNVNHIGRKRFIKLTGNHLEISSGQNRFDHGLKPLIIGPRRQPESKRHSYKAKYHGQSQEGLQHLLGAYSQQSQSFDLPVGIKMSQAP